jgi:1,2-diacylglycerol 3-beta-glucosyltransferase
VLTLLASRAAKSMEFAARVLRRFAVVIPAHNEEHGIVDTITSILRVEYPRDRFDVVVLADNCTDSTAARASGAGAVVLERREPALRGKGHALRWGFDRLFEGERTYDAFIVVDADSVVSPNYLTVMNRYLERGAPVLQSSDLVDPGNCAWNAQMTRIGFLLYNYVRPLGRNALGGTAGLRGNGMCFSAEVLRKNPWDAFSVTEDLEYGLHLFTAGVNVTFVPEATVLAVMPQNPENAEGQRARWEGGRLAIIREYAWPLLRGAMHGRPLASLDAFFDLVTPALVTITGFVLAAGLVTLGLDLLGFTSMGTYSVLWGAAAVAACVHLTAWLRIASAEQSLYRALFQLPRFALWKLRVYATMPGRWTKDVWVRTTRETR